MTSDAQSAGVPVNAGALRGVAATATSIGLTTALADFLFWDGEFGVSVALFFAGLGLLLLARVRERPRARIWILVVLLGATCVQAVIALSLSNALAATALSIALAGEVFQPQLASFWARFSEAVFGLVTAPARWLGLTGLAARSVHGLRTVDANFAGGAAFGLRVLLPALVLLAVFGSIFAAGNAAFGNLLLQANDAAYDFWFALNLTPLRLVWWGLVATIALGLFHGTRAPEAPRWWTRLVPRFPQRDVRLATWQTATALVAMNALFCVVNTLDAIFLWGQSALPAGINYSDFVHSGVNNLILAVLLSAVVIAGMFQQEDATAGRRWLKRLAHLWVLQNFLLIGGVLRRLMFYTEAYHLTEKRVYVGCFLLLTAVGFLLLAWFVQKRKSFNWLLGRNAIATFGLFFTLQFLDVAGWVARSNVARWERGESLDVGYLASLGPTAWQELIRVAESPRNPLTAGLAKTHLRELFYQPRSADWRAYQWQEKQGYRQLRAFVVAR